MSPEGRSTIVKRIQLFAVVGGLLALVAACSSNGPTCGGGNTSNDCLTSGDRTAGDTTGSIQAQRAVSRDTVEVPPPRIARPRVTASSPQWRQRNALARRHIKRAREARLRSLATCDVTGSIPRGNAFVPTVNRRLARPIEHTVIPGETLHSIARFYGTSVAAIASFNVIAQPALIRSGDTILIPRT